MKVVRFSNASLGTCSRLVLLLPNYYGDQALAVGQMKLR